MRFLCAVFGLVSVVVGGIGYFVAVATIRDGGDTYLDLLVRGSLSVDEALTTDSTRLEILAHLQLFATPTLYFMLGIVALGVAAIRRTVRTVREVARDDRVLD